MKKFNSVLSYIFIIIMSVITLFPFVYMILSSFMTFQEATSLPPTLIPKHFQWENFRLAMEQAPFVRYFFNTIIVAGLSTIGTLITSILAAFALVKLEFKYKNVVILCMAALLMVPYEVTVFTNYQTIAQLGLLDTYTALIVPSLASVFYIFYLNGYLASIPLSYYKAAKIDGCSDLEFIRRILIPLAKPSLFTMGILSFINGWNSFLWPILVTNSKEMRLLSNGLSSFATESGTNVQLQMAASTIAIVPILILYLIFRKQIIRGVVKSGIKG
ncbi:carbohydrate ABC transporter permease [Romboutsia ilealis]|uniref:Carbohydrate ABC transporter permease n=1 Tax=Romboutsia faecis TaxID=2764597 RepID=A0ABR7JQZ5_9FIRM|nr:carbohydrate ABC transporter permease [Romboutsia faecis]MBC5997207.1 carbohydrate ABC transporter permease [Romboutsia faecis]MRN23489.1 carbohydrate ABC transporter permease [Romboutsia ilealis]